MFKAQRERWEGVGAGTGPRRPGEPAPEAGSSSRSRLAADRSPDLWSLKRALMQLAVASILMGVVAEGLVHAVDAAGKAWGMNEVFLGFVVLAIVGNAAEHSTAVMLAMRNQMDTALNISMQSSVQIALFVTPLMVFLSYPLGHPLDLLFTPFEMLAVGLAGWGV